MSEETEGSSTSEETVDGSATQDAGEAGRTYTQEDLDRIVAQRVQKSKQQFKDYDTYKKAAERLTELEAANQSESERLRSQVEKASKAAQEASEREQKANERVRNTLVRAAVVSEASRQKAIDPDAVYTLLDKSQVQVGDDEVISGVPDAVSALLGERSYLVGRSGQGGGFDGGARTTAPAESSVADFNAQLRREAGFA